MKEGIQPTTAELLQRVVPGEQIPAGLAEELAAAKAREAAQAELEEHLKVTTKRQDLLERLEAVNQEHASLKSQVEMLAMGEGDGRFETAARKITEAVEEYFAAFERFNASVRKLRVQMIQVDTAKAEICDSLAELDGDFSKTHIGEIRRLGHVPDCVSADELTVHVKNSYFQSALRAVELAIAKAQRGN